jgi:hypothetical protein
MIAWDAMMVASVARMSIGMPRAEGTSKKKGFSSAAGALRSSAPCPK